MNKKKDVCPNCGYCPHCGHAPQRVVPLYPQPYYPYWPYWYGTGGYVTPTVTGTSTTQPITGSVVTTVAYVAGMIQDPGFYRLDCKPEPLA